MSITYKKTILIIYSLFLVSFVGAQDLRIDSSRMVTLRLDPSLARGTQVSKVFDEVEFIPLETSKESMFGKINQLEVAEGCFVIFDEDTMSIFIFEKDGKFRTKISNGRNANDRRDGSGFFGFKLKNEDGKTIVQLKSSDLLMSFDLKGKLIRKEPIDKHELEVVFDFPGSGMTVKLNELIKSKGDSSYFEVALYGKDKKFLTSYFPFSISKILNDDLINSGKTFFDYGVQDEVFYTRYFENNIYKISKKDASLAYQIILPEKYSLPDNFIGNKTYKGKRMEYFQKNRDKFYGIFNTYLFGNNLFFNFSSFGYGKRAFLYKLKENQLISLSDLEPDLLSSFLPVTDLGILDEFKNRGFNLYKDRYLYNSYSSLAMFALKEQNAAKKFKYNAVMTEYFKTQNKKSNPVIVRLKPRLD